MPNTLPIALLVGPIGLVRTRKLNTRGSRKFIGGRRGLYYLPGPGLGLKSLDGFVLVLVCEEFHFIVSEITDFRSSLIYLKIGAAS
jgi:hypothetical protein